MRFLVRDLPVLFPVGVRATRGLGDSAEDIHRVRLSREDLVYTSLLVHEGSVKEEKESNAGTRDANFQCAANFQSTKPSLV